MCQQNSERRCPNTIMSLHYFSHHNVFHQRPSPSTCTKSNTYVASDAPTCRPGQTRVHGVAKQERARIACAVDANPPDVKFRWSFNNSADSVDVASALVTRSGTQSWLSYTPMTELDYGSLRCSAHNKVGNQRVPCVFHIIAAGKTSL